MDGNSLVSSSRQRNQVGDADVNINYVYGSGGPGVKKPIYVFHVPDADRALKAIRGEHL